MYETEFSIKDSSRPFVCHEYDSVSEFVEVKDNPTSQRVWKEIIERFEGSDPKDWYDCSTKEEFYEILDRGHPRYVELVNQATKEIEPPQSLRRRRIMSDHGDEIDVPAMYAGSYSRMWHGRTPKTRIGKRAVRVVVQNSTLGSVSAGERKWMGVAALQIANALTIAGYNVAIDAVFASYHVTDQANHIMKVPLKLYEMPFDIQSLTSFVCFSGFWRGPAFMNKGLCRGNLSDGFGSSLDRDDFIKNIVRVIYPDRAETIVNVGNNILSHGKCDALVKEVMTCFKGEEEHV